ncbi:Hypothetical protein R9X50_00640500 [Acrodontium crateriforme]|uniref:Uncharacterized protein n=1 Tax=Acrodontium crateriforme TaxID=150365 RepID=A0AAQ3RC53_9PEZI|nr:Hypothetical protein R9X50_00640500 [Acrodontium crateriforme]
MDQHDSSRRQYDAYASQQSQSQTGNPGENNFQPSRPTERFRQQSYIQQQQQPTTPTRAPPRGNGGAQQMYNFNAQPTDYGTVPTLPSQSLEYGQDHLTGEQSQRPPQQQTPQQQTYTQYQPPVLYGMTQTQNHSAPMPYAEMSQYRPRTSGAPETLATPFGVSQTPQYGYLPGQAATTSTPGSDFATQQAQQLPQYQHSNYPQPGPSTPQQFSGNMMDPSSGAYTTAAFTPQSGYGIPQQPPPQASAAVEQGFNDYQARVRSIFTRVTEGSLRDINIMITEVSQYLLGNVEVLGLTRDVEEESMRKEIIQLWDEFNNVWLTSLQCQLDLQEMIRRGQRLQEPQTVMTQQALDQLARELLRLCDNIEKHGLVDYQMGVAEEEIMNLIIRCQSLNESTSETGGNDSEQTEHASGRGR